MDGCKGDIKAMGTLKPPLVLGTAEFNPAGYNNDKCPSKKEIVRILNLAWEAGIHTLDCADSYGCNELLGECNQGFTSILKTRDLDKCYQSYFESYPEWYYHYGLDEPVRSSLQYASVYGKWQITQELQKVIIPFNINNTAFRYVEHSCTLRSIYLRSIFDRGRLFKQGYTVKDCLTFAKRFYHPQLSGIIIGVKSVKELEAILKEY